MMIDEAGWIRVLGKLGSIRNFLTWHWKIPIGQGVWKNGFPPILKNPRFFFGGTSQPAQKKTGRAICPRKRDGFFVAERTTFLLLNPPKRIPRIFFPKSVVQKHRLFFSGNLCWRTLPSEEGIIPKLGTPQPVWETNTITMVMKTHWFTDPGIFGWATKQVFEDIHPLPQKNTPGKTHIWEIITIGR